MKNLPKLQVRVENGKKKTKNEKQKDGKYTLYAFIFVVLLGLVIGFIYLFSRLDTGDLKETRCNSYAFEKASEKIKKDLSILVNKIDPTEEDLKKTEEYIEMIEDEKVFQKDVDYYYNQCMYR